MGNYTTSINIFELKNAEYELSFNRFERIKDCIEGINIDLFS